MYSHDNYGNYDNDDDDDDDDDENVTRLIVKPTPKYVQPPTYRSIYRKLVQEEATLNKFGHKTFGVMRVSLNGPKQFLKKKSGIKPQQPKIKREHNHRPKYEHQLPVRKSITLPKTSYKPPEASSNPRKPEKNFRKLNVLNVKKGQTQITSNSSQPTAKLIKSVKRQFHSAQTNVSPSKKTPINKQIHSKYLDKPTPAQNVRKSKVVAKSVKSSEKNFPKEAPPSTLENKQDVTEPIRISKEKPKGRYVTDDERAELIYGMKKKWDEMMRLFQGLPFLTDTPPKAKRKAKMEADLKQLEKDIDEIERHPHIYVYDDDDNGGGNIKND